MRHRKVQITKSITADKILIGTYRSVGLRYKNKGDLGNRDVWETQLGLNYFDKNNTNIEPILLSLKYQYMACVNIIIDFARVLPNNTEDLEYRLNFTGINDDFNGGRYPLFNNPNLSLYKKLMHHRKVQITKSITFMHD